MRIISVFVTRTFKLIMEFDHEIYRVLDVKKLLADDSGLLAEVRDDVYMFITAKIDPVGGTLSWANGVDFDPTVLYENNRDIDSI